MADTRRFTVSDGRWLELPRYMQGGDFLRFREMDARRQQDGLTDADLEWIVRVLSERAVSSSEASPLALTTDELGIIAFRWYFGVEDEAVPQPTGT